MWWYYKHYFIKFSFKGTIIFLFSYNKEEIQYQVWLYIIEYQNIQMYMILGQFFLLHQSVYLSTYSLSNDE